MGEVTDRGAIVGEVTDRGTMVGEVTAGESRITCRKSCLSATL